MKSTVTLHTRDGHSIRGVLLGVYRDALVLTSATYLHESGEEKLTGEVVVPYENVGFLQQEPA